MHLTTDPESPLASETIAPHQPTGPPSDCHQHSELRAPPRAREGQGERHEHFYFAYGSNLSPTQMRHRCTANRSLSAKPVAIAILPRWRWFICEAGYANVLPPKEMRVNAQRGAHPALDTTTTITNNADGNAHEDVVYGVLYRMDPADERILDGYEGVDHAAEEFSSLLKNGYELDHGDKDGEGYASVPSRIRPCEQGEGDYNKWYLHAPVVQWLDGSEADRKALLSSSSASASSVPVLVYVDEERVQPGPPRTEYISRMNRAIREAITLGVPASWLLTVIRKFIPEM